MLKIIRSLVASFAVIAFAFAVSLMPVYTEAQNKKVTCPAGYTCAPIVCLSGQRCAPLEIVPGCPEGYRCTTSDAICYVWSMNLIIGSQGPDVAALQTWLIAHSFDIPVISTGNSMVQKGYFGSSTAKALAAYQASIGIPATGYFGPLTRASLNASCTIDQPTYPGFFMNTDKTSYYPGDTVTVTASRADHSINPYLVDVYVMNPLNDKVKLHSDYPVGQDTIMSLTLDQQVFYTSPGLYQIIFCDAGQVCNGGVNTNAVTFTLISSIAQNAPLDIMRSRNTIDTSIDTDSRDITASIWDAIKEYFAELQQ